MYATLNAPSLPSRAITHRAVRNRRAAAKRAIWGGLKAAVTLAAIFIKQLVF